MMSDTDGFIIVNGVLRLYTGTEADVAVPQGVVALGPDAFRECRTLRRASLPDGLKSIGKGAFWGCEQLESVRFPAGLSSIGEWGFYGCRSLESALLPEGLASLGEHAFRRCSTLRQVSLPDSLERVAAYTFESCTSLEELRLPRELREIHNSAFQSCEAIKSLVLPEKLVSVGQRAFWGCAGLESVSFDDALQHIGSDAFYYCTALGAAALPESLVSLGRCAFYGCSSLSSIRFPAHGADIGRYAFFKTPWWESRPDGCVMAGLTLYQYKGTLTPHAVLELPTETKAVAEYAFSGCAELERVIIPQGTAVIGECAFEDCAALKSVSFPDSLRKIGVRAFLRCTGLKSLSLPSGLTEIGREAFKGCARLEDLSLPSALRTVGEDAFSGCGSLRRFSMAEGAEFFLAKDGVLFSRSGKELAIYPVGRPDRSYTVPEGVERLSPGAFSGAYRLKSLFLPNTLTSLDPGTFVKTSLEYVRLPRGFIRLAPSVFPGETYVGFYYPDLAEKVNRPVFLGGGIGLLSPRHRSAALLGFLAALDHGETIVERWRDSYIDYIRHNEAACARNAGQNETLLHLMMEERLLSKDATEALLAVFMGEDRTDLTAELLAYQKKVYPPRPGEAFSLEEEPSELRPVTDAASRREALLQRIGIGGLLFSAAGNLRKFGYFSPLGLVDYSDLEHYIKRRGGQFQRVIDDTVDAVICNDPARARETLLQAARLGIPVISEAEFLQIASERPRTTYSY